MTMATASNAATRFIEFVNAAPTPFHAVAEGIKRLEAVGYKRLLESARWEVEPGGRYYVTRNASSLVAFDVPATLGKTTFSIVGTHTDSPRWIVKPVSKRERFGFAQVGVETYGGGLWATWLDRDLSVAGRVIVENEPGKFSTHLVKHPRPLLRIPTIAIHLDRNQNTNFSYNAETQMVPIIASALNKTTAAPELPTDGSLAPADTRHHPVLIQALASELGVAPTAIHDFELSLYDTQASVIGGAVNEFIFSARLDNLFSTFAAIDAMTQVKANGNINVIACFDNEEVGSVSAQGAQSSFIENTLRRVAGALDKDGNELEAYTQALARSYFLSTDMAHSCHPNFPEKHEENHRPAINGGIVIKQNASQRYATTSNSTFLLRRIAAVAKVPLQEFVTRNDMPCGSTIGPFVAKTGLRTVDIGAPQLSMHSVRETAGTQDMEHLVNLFVAVFNKFAEVDTLETGEE